MSEEGFVRCPRCGNENPGQNRFCGMCGGTLLSASAPTSAEVQPVPVAAPVPATTEVVAMPSRVPEAPRSGPSAPEPTSSISGPSFLGLSDPPPPKSGARRRASLSIDPHSAPGSNLDYLLDEEEPSRHWGAGKILLILIALALAVGFGYLRWKDQGLAGLSPLAKKPSAAAQNSSAPGATSNTPTTPSITPENPAPAAQPPASTSQPTAPPPASANSTTSPAATPAPAITNPNPAPASTDATKPTDAATPPVNSDKTSPPPDKEATTANDSTSGNPPAPEPAEKARPAPPKTVSPKPSAASKPASAYDPVAEAQKYIYGRGGAAQDCERGMRLLKPAANQSNPKAMIEMGALYSAGLCTPHDLPTAYRWFALALRKDPENTAVQVDLQKLWGEMTQPERQLAIKLSQ